MSHPHQPVEVLPPRGHGPAGSRPATSWRVKVFLATFLIVLVAGLAWDFLRAPVYRVSASLLTVAPPEAGEGAPAEADLQHVAIQRQRLLGQPLLQEVARRLARLSPKRPPPAAETLRALFRVEPVPDTNLVALRAEGEDPLFLSMAVNTWLKTYLEQRAQEVDALETRTTQALRARHEALQEKIRQRRRALTRFREQNRILSTERDENQILSRLKGLNESLNKAVEAQVQARARLDAIQAAIARGEAVVPREERRSFAALAQRAQELREKVNEVHRKYTQAYIERSPSLKSMIEQLDRLEKKLARIRTRGRTQVLSQARQDDSAATEIVQALQQRLDRMRQEASEFTARFAEYQAMQADLDGLETLARELEDRLVKVEIANRRQYPQVQVVEWAYAPEKPAWPRYWRDAALVLAAALLSALFMVWLVGFLRPRPEGTAPVQLGLAVHTGREPALSRAAPAPALQESVPPAVLPSEVPFSEPSLSMLARFIARPDPEARQLLVLLLSGVAPEEIPELTPEQLDLTAGTLEVGRKTPRLIRLPTSVLDWFERDGLPWLAWSEQPGFDRAALEARLQEAARAAGLERPLDGMRRPYAAATWRI